RLLRSHWGGIEIGSGAPALVAWSESVAVPERLWQNAPRRDVPKDSVPWRFARCATMPEGRFENVASGEQPTTGTLAGRETIAPVHLPEAEESLTENAQPSAGTIGRYR